MRLVRSRCGKVDAALGLTAAQELTRAIRWPAMTRGMTAELKVEITRFVDDAQPGFVECSLRDSSGRAWTFVEKVPVVSTDDLDDHSRYPLPGVIACTVVSNRHDHAGQELILVDTSIPWDIESTEGETRFEVKASQLVFAPRTL